MLWLKIAIGTESQWSFKFVLKKKNHPVSEGRAVLIILMKLVIPTALI